MSDIYVPQTFMSQDPKSFVDPDSLSDKWLIGRQQAQQTIQVTTQRGIHSAVLPNASNNTQHLYGIQMLSYKYFYPKDFLTCGGPHIFRICI